jgi:hypothetical protein
MHIESAATEICLIIVSPKLGNESRYENQCHTKPVDSQAVLNLTAWVASPGACPARFARWMVDGAVLDAPVK